MAIIVGLITGLPFGALSPNRDIRTGYEVEAATKKQFQLSDAQYKKVKGWWTCNSSGGWDVKFTRSKVKYYDRENGKLAWTATIKKCKKRGSIYIYYVKSERGCYEFRTNETDSNVLDYYGTWDEKNYADYYSGSSSLSRGKWGN